jgi:hypothetical protein
MQIGVVSPHHLAEVESSIQQAISAGIQTTESAAREGVQWLQLRAQTVQVERF